MFFGMANGKTAANACKRINSKRAQLKSRLKLIICAWRQYKERYRSSKPHLVKLQISRPSWRISGTSGSNSLQLTVVPEIDRSEHVVRMSLLLVQFLKHGLRTCDISTYPPWNCNPKSPQICPSISQRIPRFRYLRGTETYPRVGTH